MSLGGYFYVKCVYNIYKSYPNRKRNLAKLFTKDNKSNIVIHEESYPFNSFFYVDVYFVYSRSALYSLLSGRILNTNPGN